MKKKTYFGLYTLMLISSLGAKAQVSNDIPATAISITLGTGCMGTPYTTVGGSITTGEPGIPCGSTGAVSPVWFKFVAPTSGEVRVSNDYLGGTSDLKMAVYSATDSTDFSTFTLLSCDEDGGAKGAGWLNNIYSLDLTPSVTYYVVVDNYSYFGGAFCLTVDELSGSMLSTTPVACSSTQEISGSSTPISGWVSIMDNNAKLVAQIRNKAGMPSSTFSSCILNINTGGIRTIGGLEYGDRSWRIGNINTPAGSYDVRLFQLSTESAAISGGLANISLRKISGANSCVPTPDSFSTPATTLDYIIDPINTTKNGIDMLSFTTTSFSNFYTLNKSGFIALPIALDKIAARNNGTDNIISWNSLCESLGDSYEVQCSSDGRNFRPISNIVARGVASNYSYTDSKASLGTSYYRLRLHTASQTNGFSKVVFAKVQDGGFNLSAYPNPTSLDLNIRIAGGITGRATLTVSDISGKVVSTMNVNCANFTIKMQHWAAGVYIVKYVDEANAQSIKVNKY